MAEGEQAVAPLGDDFRWRLGKSLKAIKVPGACSGDGRVPTDMESQINNVVNRGKGVGCMMNERERRAGWVYPGLSTRGKA